MDEYFRVFHQRNTLNDHGVSDAVQCTEIGYKRAVERHFGQKCTKMFKIMDASDCRGYLDTSLHRQVDEYLATAMKDPDQGLYFLFTVNTPIKKPTKADCLKLHDDIHRVCLNDGYLEPYYFARMELFTAQGQHLHCHVMAKINSAKATKDCVDHFKRPKVAKLLGQDKPEAIHIGDAAHKPLHKRSDKFDYFSGEKQDSKLKYVRQDKAFFDSVELPQFWEYSPEEESEGAIGLVAPDYEVLDTEPVVFSSDTDPMDDPAIETSPASNKTSFDDFIERRRARNRQIHSAQRYDAVQEEVWPQEDVPT